MYLATYHAKKIDPDHSFPELTQALGFTPVWCISAESGFDLWANSILSVCEYPEYFYLSNCQNVYAISKTEWENYLSARSGITDSTVPLPEIYDGTTIPNEKNYRFEFLVSEKELFSNLIYHSPLIEVGKNIINNEGIYKDILLNQINSAHDKKQQLTLFHNLYIDTGNVIYQYNTYVLKDSNLPAPGIGLGFTGQFTNLYAQYSCYNTNEEFLQQLHNLLIACYQGNSDAINTVMSSTSPFFNR